MNRQNEHVEQGLRLKQYRKSTGLSQGEFATSLGFTQGAYSDIERGRNKLSGRLIIALAENYDVDLNWLVLGQGGMHRGTDDDGHLSDQLGQASQGKLESKKPVSGELPSEGYDQVLAKILERMRYLEEQLGKS